MAEAAIRDQMARIRSVLPAEWDTWPMSTRRLYVLVRAAVLSGRLSVASLSQALGQPPTPGDLAAKRELALLGPLLAALEARDRAEPDGPEVKVLPAPPSPAPPRPKPVPDWMNRLGALLRPGRPPDPREGFACALFSAREERVLAEHLRIYAEDDEPLPVRFRLAAQDFWERPEPARAERRGEELVLTFQRHLVWLGDVEVVAVQPLSGLGGQPVPEGSVVFRAPGVTLRYSPAMALPARLLLALLAGQLEGGGYRVIRHDPMGYTVWAGPAGGFRVDPAWRAKVERWRQLGIRKLVEQGWLDQALGAYLEGFGGADGSAADRSCPEPQPAREPEPQAPDLAAALCSVVAGVWTGTASELWALLGGEDGPFPTPRDLGLALAAAAEHGLAGFEVHPIRIGDTRKSGWLIRRR